MADQKKAHPTIFSVLEENLIDNPEREALIFGDRRITYGELGQKVDRLAATLRELGVKKGDKIAIDLPNWPEFIYSYFAVVKLGAVIVPLNTRYRSTEIEYILRQSDSVVLILAAEFEGFQFLPMIRELRPRVPQLRQVIVVGKGHNADELSFDAVLDADAGKSVAEAEIDPLEDLALIMYTSGTTGRPKGAMITHRNLLGTMEVFGEPYGFTTEDVFLAVTPISHIIGMCVFLAAFGGHARVIVVDIFKAEPVLQIIEREKVSVQFAVPTAFALELNHPNFKSYDVSSMRTGLLAGATIPVELVRQIMTEMGCDIHLGYGMTESGGGITNTRVEDDPVQRTETVGRLLRGVQVRIVDDSGHEVPKGTIGEITVKSTGVMKGYYNMPEATAEAFDEDGWFYTGDLGTIDERGYMKIAGRKKEMIIRGGFNIYPREVEDLLQTHPKILAAAVVGVADPLFGERTCACVEPKPGVTLEPGEIKEFCRGKIADFKVPDFVEIMDALPLTPTGKISKLTLKEIVAARRQAETGDARAKRRKG